MVFVVFCDLIIFIDLHITNKSTNPVLQKKLNERRLAALKQDSSESDTEDGTSCKSLNGT